MSRNAVHFFLNGEPHSVEGDLVFKTFAEYLRYQRGLVGTKIVCAEGDCGACTILRLKKGKFEPINSCITLVAHMDGQQLLTVEAMQKGNELNCVQKAMVDCHGSQCGYCTPGFIMAMSALLDRYKEIDQKTAKNHLTGNLCRCTGYQPIIEAALAAAKGPRPELVKRYAKKALKVSTLHVKTNKQELFSPITLRELKNYLAKNPQALILGAATDLGVQFNKGKRDLSHLVSLQHLSELQELSVQRGRVRVGAGVSLSDLRHALKKYPQVAAFFDLFASPQIKNMATLAGNIANASPIADTPPFLLVLGAKLFLLGPKGERELPLSDFYLDYKKTALKPGEIIVAIEFSLPKKQEEVRFYKASQRKDLDISCVNAAVWVAYDQNRVIKEARVAFGGVGPTPVRFKELETKWVKGAGEDELVDELQKCITPISDLRGSAAYRRVLAQNILGGFIRELA